MLAEQWDEKRAGEALDVEASKQAYVEARTASMEGLKHCSVGSNVFLIENWSPSHQREADPMAHSELSGSKRVLPFCTLLMSHA